MADMQRFAELVGVVPEREALLRWLLANVTAAELDEVAGADGSNLADNRRAPRAALAGGRSDEGANDMRARADVC